MPLVATATTAISIASIGIAFVALCVSGLSLWQSRRTRAEDIAPELVGSVATTPGDPDPTKNQGYRITIKNVGARDARRVGFLVILRGQRVGGTLWEGILRPGEECIAIPDLVKTPGQGGVIHGVVYGDDLRGTTYARPFRAYARQRTFRRKWPRDRQDPPSAEAMFKAFYPDTTLPPVGDVGVGIRFTSPTREG